MKGIFLLLIFCNLSLALVPLEGIVYGDIRDVRQYDPLRGLFNNSIVYQNKNITETELEKIEKYKSLHDQALNLKYSCEQVRFYTYESVWKEALAKRSVAATLQYIGLDITSKAIVKYAKNFNISENEFDNLVNNLVINNCSKNISVFSKKLLKNNLWQMYKSDSVDFTFPSLDKSPYFTQDIIDKTNSRTNKRKEFNYALKNFRSFCSWGGDTENYRLLASYLKNPILMSYVFNHLLRRELFYDKKETKVFLKESKKTAQVACEDLMCRRRNYAGFNKLFPRMVGSTSLEDDLKVLYCQHFQELSLNGFGVKGKLKKWINKKEISETIIEPMNTVSFITGIPDIFVGAEKFNEIQQAYNDTIEYRWNEWAKEKSNQLITELLYEESLFVDLDKKENYLNAKKGTFKLTFDFTLGELDRTLNSIDKIASYFNLVFPKSYLKWVRTSYIQANNRSDAESMEQIQKNFETYINVQLTKKRDYFTSKLWNENFKSIIAKNLIDQLTNYKGQFFNDFSKGKLKIPIEFRFGLFALRYLREKYLSTNKAKVLTLKNQYSSYK
jgi:hypothetical protein